MFNDQQADVSFVDFTYRKARLSILKYGNFLDIGDALTIMSKESRITDNSNIFIKTFQTEAWFMIFFILLLCSTLTSLFTNWKRILFVLIDHLAIFWGVSIRKS